LRRPVIIDVVSVIKVKTRHSAPVIQFIISSIERTQPHTVSPRHSDAFDEITLLENEE